MASNLNQTPTSPALRPLNPVLEGHLCKSREQEVEQRGVVVRRPDGGRLVARAEHHDRHTATELVRECWVEPHRGQVSGEEKVDDALGMLVRLPPWSMRLHPAFPYEFRRRVAIMVLCASYETATVRSAHHDSSLFDLLFSRLAQVAFEHGIQRPKRWRSGRLIEVGSHCLSSDDN
eukprot:TRINITY_DN18941_c0_g4_i1.p2 TRINITY_DN18941_c0_g4~~TRINITY_DN18941_c0_g4_i1.p2  ORF type:complete len:176 (+),score=12.96 TRINITY_DN18941_c0_g4_i1:169-696(+)